MVCTGCHMSYCPSTCPNYIPENAIHYCSICGNGIYNGEEYIKTVLEEELVDALNGKIVDYELRIRKE